MSPIVATSTLSSEPRTAAAAAVAAAQLLGKVGADEVAKLLNPHEMAVV